MISSSFKNVTDIQFVYKTYFGNKNDITDAMK